MDSVRKISLHSRLWIAALATALSIGTWSIAPTPANAGVFIGVGVPFPALYAQYPYYPYPPGYYPPPAPAYSPAPAMHLNRVICLRRTSRRRNADGSTDLYYSAVYGRSELSPDRWR